MARAEKETMMTEIRALRLASGLTPKEVSQEMGIPDGLYSAHECGHRRYSPKRYEQFYKEVSYAIARVQKRRRAESYQRGEYVDGEEVLTYQPLTDELFEKALLIVASGKSLINAAVHLELDEEELERRYNKIGDELYEREEQKKRMEMEKSRTRVVEF